jgi:glycosyltransferase involved in cell wall biosynthesis
MAIPTSIRPRSQDERIKLARILAHGPQVIGIGLPDDGWLCASLRIAGRQPVWVCDADPTPAAAFLERMGLPGLSSAIPDAVIGPGLRLDCNGNGNPQALRPPVGDDLPLVTILICTFNRAAMLPYAIVSALAQRWPCEIIVVDDGSTDSTPNILDGFEGIEVIRQENAGKPVALEKGLAAATGEAVLVLDDDDLLMPGALHVLAKTLFDNPELSCVYGDTIVFDGENGATKSYEPALRLPPEMTEQGVLQQIPAMPGAALVRMSAQREAGAYASELVRGQDMDMFLRLARVGPMAAVPLPTFLYRSHDGARGKKGSQWSKQDQSTHNERFFGYVQPTFIQRYREARPIRDRALGHSWALGLHLRELTELGVKEAERWPGPHSGREVWIREQLGLQSTPARPTEAVVVVDDGDPGALEATLHRHADGRAVWVDLEVPRDPLGKVRLYWPGEYAAREKLHLWVKHPGSLHVRLASSPEWAPPPLSDPGWLPDLPAVDAVLATAAALDWTAPQRPRCGHRRPIHPIVSQSWAVRTALRGGDGPLALTKLLPLLRAMPAWPGGWHMAAQAYSLAGQPDRAADCAAKVRLPKANTRPAEAKTQG